MAADDSGTSLQTLEHVRRFAEQVSLRLSNPAASEFAANLVDRRMWDPFAAGVVYGVSNGVADAVSETADGWLELASVMLDGIVETIGPAFVAAVRVSWRENVIRPLTDREQHTLSPETLEDLGKLEPIADWAREVSAQTSMLFDLTYAEMLGLLDFVGAKLLETMSVSAEASLRGLFALNPRPNVAESSRLPMQRRNAALGSCAKAVENQGIEIGSLLGAAITYTLILLLTPF
jgi:hypothetical protein